MNRPTTPSRFRVALSFPREYRARVERIAEMLAEHLGRDSILYDKWYEAEFARANLDVYLPSLYHKSDLLVFFLCGQYSRKEWCGLEWRAGRDLLKHKEEDRLMFLRLDNEDIPGLYSIDGYLDIQGKTDPDVAGAILKRLGILDAVVSHDHSEMAGEPNPTGYRHIRRLSDIYMRTYYM